MFDDLIDPDPPKPGLDTLANVSERARRLRRRREVARVIGLGAVGGLLVGALAFVVDGDPDQQSEIADSLDAGQEVVIDLGAIANPTESTATVSGETVSTATTAPSPATTGSTPVDQTTTTMNAVTTVTTTDSLSFPTEPVSYLAVGDAVMLGAAPELRARGMVVDAAVSRQMIDMIPVFEQFRDLGLFGDAVVVHLGTNGPISQSTLDSFLATMDGVPTVIILTVRANRMWTAENNALIRAADRDGDNKVLLDWEVRAGECPGNCFYDDGIHLRPEGQRYYADLISDILGI